VCFLPADREVFGRADQRSVVLVVLADTHAKSKPALTPHLRAAIGRADGVLHAGDFTTEAVLDAFETVAGDLRAVAGNRDSAAVRERLPETRVVERVGCRLLLVHGHQHNPTSLGLLARQEGADVAVVGHTHRQAIETEGELTVLNPGSHADPRGRRPGYATVARVEGGVRVRLRTAAGEDVRSIRV